MSKEDQFRWGARLFIWQVVVAALAGANAAHVMEPWTDWNYLFFACQLILLLSLRRQIRSSEDILTSWISEFFRRLGR